MQTNGRDEMRKLVRSLRGMMRRLVGSYRPEKHYMRGPKAEA